MTWLLLTGFIAVLIGSVQLRYVTREGPGRDRDPTVWAYGDGRVLTVVV